MKPEILAPAGNMEKLRAAILYGADAVYLAGKRFGMRAAADNFSLEELETAVAYAHGKGVKVYLTVNTMPREYELESLASYLGSVAEIGVDALIVSDLGVLSLARHLAPHLPIHISTQASTVNSLALSAWQRMGATRVVLAREVTLAEIVEMRRKISAELEIETFVHGSMCVSYSGRCLLSNHMIGRDGNRGACAQPCRWNYRLEGLITEEKRPDFSLPIIEEAGETFIMSSKDMCMIEHVGELIEAGVSSFKIEGRMKSAYYAATVTNAYRMATDAYLAGRPYDPKWKRELESVSHRTYGTGYFFADSHIEANVNESTTYLREKAYLATVLSYDDKTGLALCVQRNKYVAGAPFEVLTPGRVGIPVDGAPLFDREMTPIESAPHPGMEFYIQMPFPVKEGDILRSSED